MRVTAFSNTEFPASAADLLIRPANYRDSGRHVDEDGEDIIADHGVMKCHKQLLSRVSEVFKDILEVAKPDEHIDGIAVIDVAEAYYDFSDFLSLVYDPEDMAETLVDNMSHPPFIIALHEIANKYGSNDLELLLEQAILARGPSTMGLARLLSFANTLASCGKLFMASRLRKAVFDCGPEELRRHDARKALRSMSQAEMADFYESWIDNLCKQKNQEMRIKKKRVAQSDNPEISH